MGFIPTGWSMKKTWCWSDSIGKGKAHKAVCLPLNTVKSYKYEVQFKAEYGQRSSPCWLTRFVNWIWGFIMHRKWFVSSLQLRNRSNLQAVVQKWLRKLAPLAYKPSAGLLNWCFVPDLNWLLFSQHYVKFLIWEDGTWYWCAAELIKPHKTKIAVVMLWFFKKISDEIGCKTFSCFWSTAVPSLQWKNYSSNRKRGERLNAKIEKKYLLVMLQLPHSIRLTL